MFGGDAKRSAKIDMYKALTYQYNDGVTEDRCLKAVNLYFLNEERKKTSISSWSLKN